LTTCGAGCLLAAVHDFVLMAVRISQPAGQLHAKISATEKHAIERKPTGDLAAFELYARANDIG
jgi:hypothetical protein